MMQGEKKTFFVSGVCCSTEESILRRQLDELLGADGYSFNPLTCELTVQSGVEHSAIVERLRQAGFGARSKHELEPAQSFWRRHQDAVTTGTAAILATTGILLENLGHVLPVGDGLVLISIIVGGWRIFVRAWKSARVRSLDMNVLMSVAVIGAVAIGKLEEAAAVVVLFALSLMLESYSTSRTRRAIQSLMSLSPDQACVVRDGKEKLVPAQQVSPGEIILVRPGEKIPLDGLVESGSSFVEESPITGESTPVAKEPGDSVYAGAINQFGSLHVRATKRHEDTTLARIVHLVEAAHQKRAPVQHFVDRFSRIYTPTVLAIAVIITAVPPLVFNEPFGEWLYRALVLLVIACPCALVISTPVTLVSALTNAARNGILIKGGKYLEKLSKVRTIALDKTGTLTEGKPAVTDVMPLNSYSREALLQLAAAIEHRSEHHLATALLREASRGSIPFSHIEVKDFETLPGRGVRARIDGETYYVGNHELCEERGYCSPQIEQAIANLSKEGKTAIIVAKEKEALGIIATRETARHQSRHAIERLKKMGVHNSVLLSGDHEEPTRRLAEEVGIGHHEGGLLPDQKVAAVERLKAAHGDVAMVGDGINDAPALAASSVGIAMGVSGTDAALETADVVLMSDDLSKLPFLFGLSRKAISIIKQNIAIALSLKLIFFVLSLGGIATLWMAVLADDGAALIVILNGLRALSYKDTA